MRVYLPLTLELLATFDAAGSVPADVPSFVAEDESEEAEYEALMAAADASAELLGAPGQRVVLAADVDDAAAAVPKERWAAVHIDIAEDTDPDDDLAWYATQEISELLSGR